MLKVAAKVMRIIGGHLGMGTGVVPPGASLVDDLGADSLDTVTVELVIAFETAFGVEPPRSMSIGFEPCKTQ
jgi:acyl carrier protein